MLRRSLSLVPYALLSSGLALAALAANGGCTPPKAADADAGPAEGGDGGPGGGDGGPGAQERSCATEFSYDPDGPILGVEVAGEWDWSAPEPLADEDGDGVYTHEKDLEPGTYAYKLIVDRPGQEPAWILDPENPYRTYHDGVENSAARVPDCTAPLLELDASEVTGSGFRADARILRGSGGPAIDPASVRATLRHDFAEESAGAEVDGQAIHVELSGLAPGKYTLILEAADESGRAADPLRLPFWIEEEPFSWEGALIYMIVTDRFRNGDPANDPQPAEGVTPSASFHGGDLAGVTQAIEEGYLDELGVGAIWLTPFVENTPRAHLDRGGAHQVSAYHGYWPVSARAVDPRLGTAEDLEELVSTAHDHGIRVLMDFVVNHVHEDHEYFQDHPEWFRTGCQCGTPGCGWTEKRLECLFNDFMPDVDWRNPEAARQFTDDALWWLERFDLDGFRVDAVKHVEDLAVFNLSARIHEELEQAGTEYFLLGETAMGWNGHSLPANLPEYQTISRYIGPYGLNGQFDFVLYHASAYRVWADDEEGMLHLDYWTRQSQEQYPDGAIMTPFIGSHDSTRFLSFAEYGSGAPIVHNKWPDEELPTAPTTDEPYDRAATALTWLLGVPGAPLLYYGDEYGAFGAADPDNRHDFRPHAERSARERALFETVSRAARARKESAALRRGAYTTLDATESFLAFARHTAGEVAVVAINHAGAPVTREVEIPAELTAPSSLADALDPDGAPIPVEDGRFTLQLPAHGAALLVP